MAFAKLIKKWARKSDFVARFGGEEFMILMPGTCANMAEASAERLQADLEGAKFTPITEAVTASFGVAEWLDGQSADLLFKRVDEALYQAKALGRNIVVRAGL